MTKMRCLNPFCINPFIKSIYKKKKKTKKREETNITQNASVLNK